MTRQEYDKKLVEILELYEREVHEAIVTLTNKYVKDNPNRPGYSYTCVESDRLLDMLALDRAWIEDKINDGVTSFRPERREKMIRKALGYVTCTTRVRR